MAWTTEQVANAVLERLNIKPRGGSARAEDKTKMTSIYTSVHAGLRIRGLADFAISSVPDEYQEPLVKFLAGKAAGEFHFSGQRLQDKKLEAMEGLRELQILHEDRAIYDTATDFF